MSKVRSNDDSDYLKSQDFGAGYLNCEFMPRVFSYSRVYDFWHDTYQAYYLYSLEKFLTQRGSLEKIQLGRCSKLLWTMRKVRDYGGFAKIVPLWPQFQRSIDSLAKWIEGPVYTPSNDFCNIVGQYLFKIDGYVIKVCVDASDSGLISSESLLQWSDVYFKTNYWVSREYPEKVLPLANGNPNLIGNMPQLFRLRAVRKKYDLCFVVRIRCGSRTSQNLIEHHIRLLEEIRRIKGKNYILAVLRGQKIDNIRTKLDKLGIRWVSKPIPMRSLWNISAKSQVTVMRLGAHFCVPWRMFDTLAMGACPILDHGPYTVWHSPLVSGKNYLDLALNISPSWPVAPNFQYNKIQEKIECWLSNPEKISNIQKANALYFDKFLTPKKLGKAIFQSVVSRYFKLYGLKSKD
jgi:hypothetical protein